MSEDRQRKAVLSGCEAVAFDRWETPPVAPAGSGGYRGMPIADLEALQQQAYDEAYALGLREGRTAGENKVCEDAQRLASMLDLLARPLEELDECVESQLVQLAMIVARKIVRRELKSDPSHVIGVVRDALAVLPVAARDVCVQLHPEDAELVRSYLKPVEGERAWRVVENPVLSRGGCRVESETSRIDASIESRLATLLAAIVGDERESAAATSNRSATP